MTFLAFLNFAASKRDETQAISKKNKFKFCNICVLYCLLNYKIKSAQKFDPRTWCTKNPFGYWLLLVYLTRTKTGPHKYGLMGLVCKKIFL